MGQGANGGPVEAGKRWDDTALMKISRLDELPFAPVSHDPELKKKVLVNPGIIPHLIAMSHARFMKGQNASAHKHVDAFEVFYGISGRFDFAVENKTVPLTKNTCLIVEPGEVHSLVTAENNSEMIYFLLKK